MAQTTTPAKRTTSASHHGKREGTRRELHSQIERRRHEKINDRLIVLRNTVPACALLMARRLGCHLPLKGPLASRYSTTPSALADNAALQASLLGPGAGLPPRSPDSVSAYYEVELGLNKLDVLTHTVDYVFELHTYIDDLLKTQAALQRDLKAAQSAPSTVEPRAEPCHRSTLNSLQRYRISVSAPSRSVQGTGLPRCFDARSSPPAGRTPELVAGRNGSFESTGSDGGSSRATLSPPGMGAMGGPPRLPTPLSLPQPLSSCEPPIHLPFPSVLLGKTLSAQEPPSPTDAGWSAQRPPSPPGPLRLPRAVHTGTPAPASGRNPSAQAQEDARLLMDLHSSGAETVGGTKRSTAMAVDSLVTSSTTVGISP